jgi:hypothetical protein
MIFLPDFAHSRMNLIVHDFKESQPFFQLFSIPDLQCLHKGRSLERSTFTRNNALPRRIHSTQSSSIYEHSAQLLLPPRHDVFYTREDARVDVPWIVLISCLG